MSDNPSYITKGNKGSKGNKRENERGKITMSDERGKAKKTRTR
jgi:hypothetical protein